MKSPLLWKIVGIQMSTVCLAIAIVGVAVHVLAADHFMSLMEKYNIPQDELEGMFLEAIDRYFVGATLAAGIVALVMSALLTRQILGPLKHLMLLAHDIGGGKYAARAAPHRGELGKLAAALNQMAESLERTDRLRRSLVADVAHELRTPLTNMRGYLEALRDGVVPSSRETFESLHDETLRVTNLVDDMVRLGRDDAAKSSLVTTPISLAQLIRRSIAMFRARLDEKEIATETDVAAIDRNVLADKEKINQVLTNLLDNACRYSPVGGRLSIRGEWTPSHVRVIVSNSADPIPDDDLRHLFERFYRIEQSRSREYGGAGLGLAIVKELIKAHGGDVGAEYVDGELLISFQVPAET